LLDFEPVTLIQRFGLAANLNIHLHCLVLDGVYRCDTEGEPVPLMKAFWISSFGMLTAQFDVPWMVNAAAPEA